MSSTVLTLPLPVRPMPLFFRLDVRSQRLVALTDVMQTPLYWLDEPRSPWPTQLPPPLREPIEAQLASGQGGQLTIRALGQEWRVSLSPEQGHFWLICLQIGRAHTPPNLSLLLPRLGQLASRAEYAPMLQALWEGSQADRLILWHFDSHDLLTPIYQLGVKGTLFPIKADGRYLRTLRSRGSLSFSECAHQPMLAQHRYLASHGVAARLDAALREGDRLLGMLSLEYLDPVPLGEELLQLARFCSQQLGQWQPPTNEPAAQNDPEEASHDTHPLALHVGLEYCRALLQWCRQQLPLRAGWVGEYQRRGEELWLIPRYVELEGQPHSSLPQRLEPGPAHDIHQSGQALYLDNLATRYPKAHQLLAFGTPAYIGVPLLLPDGTPIGQLTLLPLDTLDDPLPLLDRLSELAPRLAIEMQRLSLEEALRLAEVAFDTHDAMVVCDANGQILKANRAFTRTTGYAPEQVVGQHIRLLRPPYYGDDLASRITRTIEQQRFWEGEEQCLNHEGRFFPVRLQVSGVFDGAGRLTHYVSSFHDLTEEREAQQHIERLAYYDDLTGLLNRRSMLTRLQQRLQEPHRQWGALLYIDLDNFKSVNDSLGHQRGDELLLAVVERLRELPQENLLLARSSGDEFQLLFTDLGQGQVAAKILAEHFAREVIRLFRQPFSVGHDKLHCSASLGVALFSPEQHDHLVIMQQADTAAHIAKRNGHGQYAFFNHHMAEQEKSRLAISNQLRDALRRGEFQLHYQPQFRVDSGVLTGIEALIRWQRADGVMVAPGEFIPVAEESGLIEDIGYWVLKSACAQFSHWLSRGVAIPQLSVNVSARQFHNPAFLQQVEYVLRDTGLPPSRLMLEITESVVLEHREESIERMRRLRSLGVLISIDDFGTGYSSLAYLRDLPANEVKLDRSFILTLVHSEQDRALVRAVVELAKVFRFTVIAEGVEEQEQLAILADIGCQHFQGYLRCRPLPVRALESFLADCPTAG
ncbi:sensor domain-containing phosphodiesterase [Aeromonas simiae]|uniref:sensor domain-containing phosphodiesterase n=1 Tax=Aeromonas simiae TaxID=218936 RepID=UPI0005A5E674|nr:EAL domain-containing protein [Aeromonas simiae]